MHIHQLRRSSFSQTFGTVHIDNSHALRLINPLKCSGVRQLGLHSKVFNTIQV